MPGPAEMERQRAALRDLDNIMSGMRAYAAVTIRKTDALVPGVRAFEEALRGGLADLAPCCPELFAARPRGRARIVVAFGSSQGLCGAFNEHLAAAALREVAAGDLLVVVGRRLRQAAGALGRPADRFHEAVVSVNAIGPSLRGLVGQLMADYTGADYLELVALFMEVSGARAEARLERVLPPDLEASAPDGRPPEPPLLQLPARSLIEALLPEFLGAGLTRAALESLRSENWHRLRSLEGATENLRRRIESLESLGRYLRQEEITEEMLEILGTGMFYGRQP